ncbi:hypothetical protein L1887_42462 [Cichorium endivia]|nr:hypothetical protein L1887_42462 [Cichorium endivia]
MLGVFGPLLLAIVRGPTAVGALKVDQTSDLVLGHADGARVPASECALRARGSRGWATWRKGGRDHPGRAGVSWRRAEGGRRDRSSCSSYHQRARSRTGLVVGPDMWEQWRAESRGRRATKCAELA